MSFYCVNINDDTASSCLYDMYLCLNVTEWINYDLFQNNIVFKYLMIFYFIRSHRINYKVNFPWKKWQFYYCLFLFFNKRFTQQDTKNYRLPLFYRLSLRQMQAWDTISRRTRSPGKNWKIGNKGSKTLFPAFSWSNYMVLWSLDSTFLSNHFTFCITSDKGPSLHIIGSSLHEKRITTWDSLYWNVLIHWKLRIKFIENS